MAQPLTCDATDCTAYADVLVSRLANGETLAWCDPHFVQMCQAVADSLVQAEVDETDAEALRRLGADADPATFPTPPESSGGDDRAAGPPTQPDSAPERPDAAMETTPDPIAAPEPVPGGRGRSGRAG